MPGGWLYCSSPCTRLGNAWPCSVSLFHPFTALSSPADGPGAVAATAITAKGAADGMAATATLVSGMGALAPCTCVLIWARDCSEAAPRPLTSYHFWSQPSATAAPAMWRWLAAPTRVALSLRLGALGAPRPFSGLAGGLPILATQCLPTQHCSAAWCGECPPWRCKAD